MRLQHVEESDNAINAGREINKTWFNDAYFRPIIPLLFSFIAGIIIADYLPPRPVLVISAGLPIFIIIIYFLVSGKNSKIFPLILYAFLGYLSYASSIDVSMRQAHVAHYMDGKTWKIAGTIDLEPIIQSNRQKCILNNIRLSPASGDEPPRAVNGRIQATIYGNAGELCAGDKITLASEIKPFRSFHNPGGFDYIKYMTRQNIWGNTYASADRLEKLPSKSTGLERLMNAIRKNILELIVQISEGDSKAVLSALLVGDRRGISNLLQDAFNRTGVSHVLSISGLHVGIVATAAFVFFKWVLSFFKPLLLRAWTRKGAALLAVFPVVFYGMIAGMEPATLRSVIMVSVFLLTFLIERDHDLFNTIALAALAILIVEPPALFSISFQLSFMAVLAIAWGTNLFGNRIYPPGFGNNYIVKSGITIVFVTLLATIGTSPLVMYYFNIFPIFGVIANLVVVPLMGSAVVIIGLVSVLLFYPLSTQAASWGLQLCDVILKPTIAFVNYLSQMRFCAIRTITPSVLEIICFYVLLSGMALLISGIINSTDKEKTEQHRDAAPSGCRQPRRLLIVIIISAVAILAADMIYWTNHRLWHDDFRVTVLDVGQGNAALLEFPKGKCAVIDGGGFSDNSMFDVGERVLAPYLWRNKIRTVDTVILTHPDSDHLNGLVFILKYFNVKQVFSTHQASESRTYQEFIALIDQKKIDHPIFFNIQRPLPINGATLEILYPPKDFNIDNSISPSNDPNNNSMVIKAGFGRFSILFPGDIMAAAEEDLHNIGLVSLKSNILIAPHHGSKNSSTPSFLDSVSPEAIIISSGKPDQFPAKSVLEQYEERHYKIFRTDENGAVKVVMDGEKLSIRPTIGNPIEILN